jgi:hypothetical protein
MGAKNSRSSTTMESICPRRFRREFAWARTFPPSESKGWTITFIPHSARNGRRERIKKQVQGANSNVGRREKRNLKYGDVEETN